MSPNLSKIAAVILSAGKGTRLNCTDKPKVMLEIGGRPIVAYIVETLQKIGFNKEQICLVVGFKKEIIEDYFGGSVSYGLQEQQLGTAHAAYVGIKSLPNEIEQVIVLGGDDGAFYKPETILNLITAHLTDKATISFLTATVANPGSFGRVVRENDGIKIIEKEYLTAEQQNIKEVNTGTYVVDRHWFEKEFPSFPKMQKLGEFGMNPSITIAESQGKKVQAIKLSDNNEWHGINTVTELELADQLKRTI